jgi:hypothetical protein
MDGGVFMASADVVEGAEGSSLFFANTQRADSGTSYGAQSGVYQIDVNAFNLAWVVLIERWADPESVRTWTAADGRKVEAEYLSATATHVKFRRVSDGVVFEYELAKLSEADRAWVRSKQQR